MSAHGLIARIYREGFIFAGTALAVAVVSTQWPVLANYTDVIVVMALIGVALDFHAVKYHGTNVSASMMIWVFASVSFPPTVTIPTVALSRIAYSVLAGQGLRESLFSLAQMVLTVTVAAAIYHSSATASSHLLATPGDYGLLAIAALAYLVTNIGLVTLAVGFAERRSVVQVLRRSYSHLPLYYLGMTMAGALMAALWQDRLPLVPAVVMLGLLTRPLLTEPRLREETLLEGKTGLYNAKHFRLLLDMETRRAARHRQPFAVIMADIDRFKGLNDAYGHLAGDAVLKGIAEILKASIRDGDAAARFGGEEFAVLVPRIAREPALGLAERIRRRVEDEGFVVPTNASPIHTSISLGVACYPDHGSEAEELLRQADLAMYEAKSLGRNRVRVAAGAAAETQQDRKGPPAP